MFCVKYKIKFWFSVYEKPDLLLETNKKGFWKRIHINETHLLCMHHILKKKKKKNLT